MRMDELKKGFWGYKKEGVYRCIVALEEESSQKLAEKEARLVQLEAQSQSRIAELERTLEALREENVSLKANQAAVFSTLLEAQRHAERLREESSRREQRAQEELRLQVQRQTQKLDTYAAKVQQLRDMLHDMLADFDGRAEEAVQALAALQEQAPGPARSGVRIAPQQPGQEPQESDTWKKLLSM